MNNKVIYIYICEIYIHTNEHMCNMMWYIYILTCDKYTYIYIQPYFSILYHSVYLPFVLHYNPTFFDDALA